MVARLLPLSASPFIFSVTEGEKSATPPKIKCTKETSASRKSFSARGSLITIYPAWGDRLGYLSRLGAVRRRGYFQ